MSREELENKKMLNKRNEVWNLRGEEKIMSDEEIGSVLGIM